MVWLLQEGLLQFLTYFSPMIVFFFFCDASLHDCANLKKFFGVYERASGQKN